MLVVVNYDPFIKKAKSAKKAHTFCSKFRTVKTP